MGNVMNEEYDIKNLNPQKNPYAKQLKKQVTMNLKVSTINYFKAMAAETGIPYQTLIDVYLDECAQEKRKIHIA